MATRREIERCERVLDEERGGILPPFRKINPSTRIRKGYRYKIPGGDNTIEKTSWGAFIVRDKDGKEIGQRSTRAAALKLLQKGDTKENPVDDFTRRHLRDWAYGNQEDEETVEKMLRYMKEHEPEDPEWPKVREWALEEYGDHRENPMSETLNVPKTSSGQIVMPLTLAQLRKLAKLDKMASEALDKHGFGSEEASPAVRKSLDAAQRIYDEYSRGFSLEDHREALDLLQDYKRSLWDDLAESRTNRNMEYVVQGFANRHSKDWDRLREQERESAFGAAGQKFRELAGQPTKAQMRQKWKNPGDDEIRIEYGTVENTNPNRGGWLPMVWKNGTLMLSSWSSRAYDKDEALEMAKAAASDEADHYSGDWDLSIERRENPSSHLQAGSPAVAQRLTAYARKIGWDGTFAPQLTVKPEGGFGYRYVAYLDNGDAYASFYSEEKGKDELGWHYTSWEEGRRKSPERVTDHELRQILMSRISAAIRNSGDNKHIADKVNVLLTRDGREAAPQWQVDRVMETLSWEERRKLLVPRANPQDPLNIDWDALIDKDHAGIQVLDTLTGQTVQQIRFSERYWGDYLKKYPQKRYVVQVLDYKGEDEGGSVVADNQGLYGYAPMGIRVFEKRKNPSGPQTILGRFYSDTIDASELRGIDRDVIQQAMAMGWFTAKGRRLTLTPAGKAERDRQKASLVENPSGPQKVLVKAHGQPDRVLVGIYGDDREWYTEGGDAIEVGGAYVDELLEPTRNPTGTQVGYLEVVPSRRWVNKKTGATASIYGSAPYVSAADEKNWSMETVGWTWRDDRTGTVGMGRRPVKTKAEAIRMAEKWTGKKANPHEIHFDGSKPKVSKTETADFLEESLGLSESDAKKGATLIDDYEKGKPGWRDRDTQMDANDILRWIDDKGDGTHGIETIFEDDDGNLSTRYGSPLADYINTGDTYAGTVLYDSGEDKFFLTTYGDWVERYEREALEYLLENPEVYLDNMDREEGEVMAMLKGPHASKIADGTQSIMGSSWECTDDNFCYAIIMDYKGLVEDLETGKDGPNWSVDEGEYYEPDEDDED